MGREGVPARRVLLAIVLVALVVRVAVAALPIVHHEDEIWQYLEPAYGAVTGRWIETWDIREGIRSWLMPVLLMPGVALGHALAPRSGLQSCCRANGWRWRRWRWSGRSGRWARGSGRVMP